MPKLDLSRSDGKVDPLAGARLLALMTYPGEPTMDRDFVLEALLRGLHDLDIADHQPNGECALLAVTSTENLIDWNYR